MSAEPGRVASPSGTGGTAPVDETQVFTFHVEGVMTERTLLATRRDPFDETYEIRAEHPADGLEKLLHEIEWGILDSYAGFTITVTDTDEVDPDA